MENILKLQKKLCSQGKKIAKLENELRENKNPKTSEELHQTILILKASEEDLKNENFELIKENEELKEELAELLFTLLEVE